jgi:hypothetical protein
MEYYAPRGWKQPIEEREDLVDISVTVSGEAGIRVDCRCFYRKTLAVKVCDIIG